MAQTVVTYVIVQNGDTLESIARRYRTSVLTVARLNGLTKEAAITAGQLLQVPKPRPEPGYKQHLLARPRTPRYAFAFCTGQEGIYPGSDKALVREGEEGLSGIFPLWFQVAPSEPWRLQSFVAEEQILRTVQTARERRVNVLPALSNLYYNGGIGGREVVRQAMRSHQHQLAETLIRTYSRIGADGICLDWTDLHPEDNALFVQWVETLAEACRQASLRLVVQIPLLAGDDGQPRCPVSELQRLSRSADLVSLMLNTEHRMYTLPGPISSLDWAESGIRSVLAQGLEPGKTLLGLAGYAYDWKESSQVPEYLSFDGAMNRARQYRVHVVLDADSQTPTYTYRDSSGTPHQVWFENTSSLSQKITLINRHELAGLSLWRLGIEDPNMWPLLRGRWGAVKKWDAGFRNKYYDK
ncbi:glycosyl hydrolase family 18 protein [Tumebacillus sp. DT12]|uniref:Glycosyl hydrolase family 18 protein n=1 Tax=Tumebacillus lacus TaxID=2995335 RepID=A0ABT3WZJ5_9BACL|nr:glycosyl hydrolase family 18 protein [Tumebacillus lacus]MCX7568746.1 glycosyl hydrolase family 18 protein [Tumebacillus lacus]